ncbi:MAG: septum formation initiator family protein [Microbacteriaceae bacterium]|nr:septum formation initiator family protein [Microbacteriaceae bacterium]
MGGKSDNKRSDLKHWAQSLRFGSSTMLLLALIVVGVVSLTPPLTTFLQQRAQISDLRKQVEESRKAVASAEEARSAWEDKSFIRSQARNRLFYVMPGESQVGIIKDIDVPAAPDEKTSADLLAKTHDWRKNLLQSFINASKQ